MINLSTILSRLAGAAILLAVMVLVGIAGLTVYGGICDRMTVRKLPLGVYRLDRVMTCQELFASYPALRRAWVVYDVSPRHAGPMATGHFDLLGVDVTPEISAGDMRIQITAPTAAAARGLLAHEIQHAIQYLEGRALDEAEAYRAQNECNSQAKTETK